MTSHTIDVDLQQKNIVNGSTCDAHPQDMKVFVGTLVHATHDTALKVLPDAVLGVLGSKIMFVEAAEKLTDMQTQYCFQDRCVTRLTSSQFLMPGMVDTHIHAPQFPNIGLKMDLPLLEWLEKYTFPTEASIGDPKVADEVYRRVVDRVLRNGTTTASYFATLHLASSKVLAKVASEKGQRALVGKVNMVRNCPDYYCEANVPEALRETEEFIQYVRSLQSPLVMPVVTPRFALTCPEDLLQGLGRLAAKYRCHVQTHLSESRPEVALVREFFPDSHSYSHVYQSAGLLTNKTILAHCVWLGEEEEELLAGVGAGVAHCPNSNLNLFSGHCNVRRLLKRGLKVGLGTDCSGGYSPSILDALRRALHVSCSLLILHPDHEVLTMAEAFRLATLGGAQVVHMEDRIGNFEVGKEFDALMVDVEAPDSPLDIFGKDDARDKIQKFLYNGDDRNIMEVYVAGRCVSRR